MDKLEMIKAFAELEGVELMPLFCKQYWYESKEGKEVPYNPITDLALTMKAVIDYGVDIYQSGKVVSIDSGCKLSGATVEYYYSESLPRAIVECILKTRGKWI